MKIVIKERKQANLIYLMDEVGLSPLSANIVSKEETKVFVTKLLNSNTKINKVETMKMTDLDLF